MTTCIACRLQFEDFEKQREHYRSALHCFNLQRKVSGLPPLTEELFQEKVEAVRLEQEKTPSSKKTKLHGKAKRNQPMRRVNLTVLENDLTREREAKAAADAAAAAPPPGAATIADGDSDAEQEREKEIDEMVSERLRTTTAVPAVECLFSGRVFDSPSKCRHFMRQNYALFVPDGGHLTDEDGLYTYLAEKVGIGFTCIWCDRAFTSLHSVREHMVARQHTRMRFEGFEEEYTDFYDFEVIEVDDDSDAEGVGGSSSDAQSRRLYDELLERSGTRAGADGTLVVYEDVPSSSGVHVADNGLELVLPNGTTIGHRALRQYYKQKHYRRTSAGHAQVIPYRADAFVRRADIAPTPTKREQRRRTRLVLKVQMQGNMVNTRHFRKQVMV